MKNFYTKYCLLPLICLLYHTSVWAQDTIKQKNDTIFHRFFYMGALDALKKIDYTYVDTTLHAFQAYEPAKNTAFLGNTGKAYSYLIFGADIKQGFNIGENVFRNYVPTYDKVKYFNVSSPYSDLYYVMGSNKEQILKVTHAQNVNKEFNFSLHYNIINSNGAFRRQKTDISSFVFSSNYISKNKRYAALGNVIANKWYNNENGGLSDMSIFTSQLLDRPDQFDVRLVQAQNRVKERGVFIKQYVNLFKVKSSDTLNANYPEIYNTRLSHSLHYNKSAFAYIDEAPLSGFYPLIIYDSLFTGDSSAYNYLSNEIALNQVFARNKNDAPILYAQIGVENQYIDNRQFISHFNDSVVYVRQKSYYFNQYIAKGIVGFNPAESINLNLSAYSVLGGYNSGDIGLKACLRLTFDSLHYIVLKASMDNVEPAYTTSRFVSNHFNWQYDFDKMNVVNIKALHFFKGFKTELQAYQLYNYVYYANDALPQQYDKSVQVLNLSVSKLFQKGAFYLNNHICLQQSTNSSIISVPLLLNNHSLYFGTHLFKKALFAQVGTDFYYYSKYYGLDYMPATRQFYMQQHTKTGNYPFVDFFVNMRIKRALIFVKLTHLNQGLMGYTYYSVPNYPLQGRAFKLGISWKFYD